MCGIFAVFGLGSDVEKFRTRALSLSKKIRHRGPDWNGLKVSGNNIIAHERLAIVGIDTGAQPLTNHDESVILSVNGEIYNHKALRKLLQKNHEFKTHSDCEVILYLYEEMGEKFINLLDGIFSFVLYDVRKNSYIVARDPIGITTLYQGWRSSDNSVWFCSEMKSLNEDCDRTISFPPGQYYSSVTKKTTPYYNPTWYNPDYFPPKTEECDYVKLRTSLEKAVKKRLMTEVPYGVLLSGGLDSSLIAAIAARYTKRVNTSNVSDDYIEEAVRSASLWPRLHSFSIGLKGSPDLKAAKKVADFLETAHHEFTFTVQEGLDAVHDVIYHLETYDVTTIRASTPMYLLTRKIKAMGVKMVLSGEGSDEIFGGYLYFHQAPNAESFHKETVTRVKNLNTSDCLRANKSTMAWGVEARVPFLDKEFLDVAMTIDPRHKMCGGKRMEKYIVRKAFDTPEDPYLPHDILWRQKEQFSDGVGYSWIDTLKATAERSVTDDEWAARATRFPHDTPTTREAYYYRVIFQKHFPQKACLETVVRWIPRLDWGCSEDPSGRAQAVHQKAYAKPSSPAKTSFSSPSKHTSPTKPTSPSKIRKAEPASPSRPEKMAKH